MEDNQKTLIIGALGSMGARYQAILGYLGLEFECVDKEDSEESIISKAQKSSEIIICTPTETHFSYLKKLIPLQIPILCEKPISKNLMEMEEILDYVEAFKTKFSMAFQYSELIPKDQSSGRSYYNYFRSGRDGIVWDCLQIIALAKGDVVLLNESPIWKCMINGLELNLSDMDAAYVTFIEKWINGQIHQTTHELFKIHEKVERLKYEYC